MKIIQCHNFYQQPGGEDRVFRDEGVLLSSHGHDVIQFTAHNDEIVGMSKIGLARRAIWNGKTAAELRDLVRREQAEIVHFHNTVPLISPAAYYAARKAGAAVVQTLHNYRMICAKATFFRDGKVCEDCLGKFIPWPAVWHGCYRESRAASAVLATMLTTHRLMKTYAGAVDAYIACSHFSKQKLVKGGLPEAKISVKPNFVDPDPGVGRGVGGYAMYLGRLSPEKGLDTLLAAWSQLPRALRLKIVGNGPMSDDVRNAAQQNSNIEWLAGRSDQQVREILADAAFLVLPSVNYEGFPKTIVEAFALGTPVVASRLGAMAEVIEDGRTGVHFEAGSASDLAAKVDNLFHQPRRRRRMRAEAREEYLRKYTAETNYRSLMEIYNRAISSHSSNKIRNREEVVAS